MIMGWAVRQECVIGNNGLGQLTWLVAFALALGQLVAQLGHGHGTLHSGLHVLTQWFVLVVMVTGRAEVVVFSNQIGLHHHGHWRNTWTIGHSSN